MNTARYQPRGGGLLWKLAILCDPGHLRAWLTLLRRNNRSPWRACLKMPLHLAQIFREWANGSGVDHDLYLDRLVTCAGFHSTSAWEDRKPCPVYDLNLRRCGPYDGSAIGCQCYTPFLALLRQPYKALPGCWARQFQIEDTRFGGPLGWL